MRNNKILEINNLKKIILSLKKKKRKIVQCHGVFDLLHIGHIRHFRKAKASGDFLIVTLTADKFVKKGFNRPFFNQKLRLEALSSIEYVDAVCLSNNFDAAEVIKLIKPDIYFKGSDYKNHSEDVTGNIILEKKTVEKFGGKIVYSDDITFSSSNLINKYGSVFSETQSNYINKIKKNFNSSLINKYFEKISKLKILVVGEVIIDQYIFLETLGKSGKEPYLASRELYRSEFLGGAAAVAKNLSTFSKNIDLVTMIGQDKKYKNFITNRLGKNINVNFFYKTKSPTIIKKRFIDNITKNKLFGSYQLNDELLDPTNEIRVINGIKKKRYDLVIVLDYGHGFITEDIAKNLVNLSSLIAINAQINSSNIGYHSLKKYKKSDLLIINETELRHETRNKSENIKKIALNFSANNFFKNLIVTRGSNGSLFINKNNRKIIECPAFAEKVVDRIGAGDTMLSVVAPLISVDAENEVMMLLGNLAGAFSVKSIGNSEFLDKIQFIKNIQTILK
jgi:rfaE bifunctional protein kinase chain/domain/rfaE bifunctional protein nucleotidyltransferase chain/domain